MSYTRREVLRMAGAGGAALWLGGCGGSSNTAKPVPGDEWKQFGGTTLNFISENTAPTSAIAANLEPFNEADGDRHQDHPARADGARAEGRARLRLRPVGSYQLVYADPYQILAPYHEALVDLNTMMDDDEPPEARRRRRLHPDPARRRRASFVDKDKLYALPYDAPTMIWQYRKDLFEKHGEQMKQDLGFDPTPGRLSTWEEFYKTSKWFKDNADETKVPYGHGHQAKQHDSLMNDFSNVLWAYGGDYFKDGDTVGRLGSSDPGEPILDSAEAVEAADFYRRLVSIAHPGSLGWDWDGLGAAFAAGQMAMAVNWHEFAAGNEDVEAQGQGRLRAPPPRAPSAARACTAGRASGSTPPRPRRSRRPPGCSSTGRPRRRRSSPTSRATSAAARRRATRSTSCPRSRRRRSRRRRCRTSSRASIHHSCRGLPRPTTRTSTFAEATSRTNAPARL